MDQGKSYWRERAYLVTGLASSWTASLKWIRSIGYGLVNPRSLEVNHLLSNFTRALVCPKIEEKELLVGEQGRGFESQRGLSPFFLLFRENMSLY